MLGYSGGPAPGRQRRVSGILASKALGYVGLDSLMVQGIHLGSAIISFQKYEKRTNQAQALKVPYCHPLRHTNGLYIRYLDIAEYHCPYPVNIPALTIKERFYIIL